jgi:hypothetical protein
MMNWKGFERKGPWLNFKILSQNSSGVTDENQEKYIRIAGLRVEI